MIWGLYGKEAQAATIRPVTGEDSRLLADCHASTFDRPWTDGEFHTLLSSAGVSGFVAAVGSKSLAGFVISRRAADEEEIVTIAVDADWRRRGIGAKLLDAVLRASYANGVESVFLEVDETNQSAIALYRKLGFAQVGRRPDYYAQAPDRKSGALVMRRDVR